MKTPLVALVGRPNVGKSSLFNALTGKRISIVSDEAGTTRDRILQNVEWSGANFTLVDTGGVDFDVNNLYSTHIKEQVDIAIDLADVIIFLVDGETGITPADSDIANMLRKCKKPIVLAVNKLDNTKRDAELYDFYRLKVGEPIAISCTQHRGLGDLCDAVMNNFKGRTGEIPTEAPADNLPLRISIVGKPNAGKSSITNKLLGENRVMVADMAGTTRDSIDTPFTWHEKKYILTDTAGVRRKRSVEVQTVEHYSVLRALAAIRNADVCVLVIDATEGITEQDVRLAGYIHDEGKPSVIVVNKWDAIEGEKSRLFLEWGDKLRADLAYMPYFRSVFTSAKTGQRIGEIMSAVTAVYENSCKRITTGKLNQLFMDFVSVNPIRAKVKYVTQVGINPPTFAIFVSKKQFLPPTYERYLENSLRKSVDFSGTPIKIYIRENVDKREGK
jgi:GTP-binding protein